MMLAFIYWILAIIIFILMSTLTFTVASLLLNLLLKEGLPYGLRKIWNGFVSVVTYTTCFFVTIFAKPEKFQEKAIESWPDLFFCLEHLLKVEIKWFSYAAVFLAVIVGLIIIVPYHSD